jgi:hypothetical protein
MIITVKCRVFKYDELPADFQKKLLQKEWEAVAEIYHCNHLINDFKERLNEIGFTNAEVWYTYYNGQNDGAVFDAEMDYKKICNHLGIEYNPDWEDGCFSIGKVGNYNRKHSREVVSNLTSSDSDKILQKIENLRLDLCDKFFSDLVADFESETEKEHLLENLRSRRYVYNDSLCSSIEEATQRDRIQII